MGKSFFIPVTLLVWIWILWLAVLLSGQRDRVELIALVCLASVSGVGLWAVTGGEAWLSLSFLGTPIALLENLRSALLDRIFTALPEPHGSLLAGILLGNRVKLDKELVEMFRVVGLSHLIAVSGYNLSILTKNSQTILQPLLGRRAVYVSFALIAAFVILSGAPSSILRAAVMAGTILFATLIGRPNKSVNTLVFAAGALSLFEPKIVFEIGFQLSLIATYALIRLAPLLEEALNRWPQVPATLRSVLSETLSASLFTAPLLIMYFERLSVVTPISNILVVPLIPLVMGIGLLASPLLLLIPSLGTYIALLDWPLLEWVMIVSRALGTVPYATIDISLPQWAGIAVMLGMIAATEFLQRQTADKLMISKPRYA